MKRLGFALLIAAIFAHIWFASLDWPLGGPNVWLAGLAVAAAGIWRVLAAARGVSGVVDFGKRLWAAGGLELPWRRQARSPTGGLPALTLAVAVALLAWGISISLSHGVMDAKLLAKMALGVGVLFAVVTCVDSARRGAILALAVVAATALSALFGMGLMVFGEPFLSVWLRVASVWDVQLERLLSVRVGGLAVHPSSFGYQLAVAIPLAVGAVSCLRIEHRLWSRLSVVTLIGLILAMVVMLVMNDSRASVIGTLAGVAVCSAACAWGGDGWRRLLAPACLAVTVLALIYAPRFISSVVRGDDGRHRMEAFIASDAFPADASDPSLTSRRFTGHVPGVRYEVRLLQRHAAGIAQWRVGAQADENGEIALAWRRSTRAGFFVYLSRPFGATDLPWSRRKFLPVDADSAPLTIACPGAGREPDELLTIDGFTASEDPLWGADPDIVGATFAAPTGSMVELRACPPDWCAQEEALTVPPSLDEPGAAGCGEPVAVTAPSDFSILTWRAPTRPRQAISYRWRARPDAGADWRPWQRDFRRGLQSAGGPSQSTLATSARALAVADRPAIGHEFPWFRESLAWEAQVRWKTASGYAPPLAAIVEMPRNYRPHFVLAWAVPDVPAGSESSYQFRMRPFGETGWLDWTNFSPRLSSRGPMLTKRAADAAGARRHSFTKLAPGVRYQVQVRARNEHGFGVETELIAVIANDQGVARATWAEPAVKITGYQFRILREGIGHRRGEWSFWQDFAPSANGNGRTAVAHLHARPVEDQVTYARLIHRFATDWRRQPHARANSRSAEVRMKQLAAMWRYIRDHPLGTGAYLPEAWHMDAAAPLWVIEQAMALPPHNQFLHTLGVFGFPGLFLLVAFYALVARAALGCARVAVRGASPTLRFLAAGAVSGWLAYLIASLFLPTGPLLHDWGHCFLIGLLLALPRLNESVKARAARMSAKQGVIHNAPVCAAIVHEQRSGERSRPVPR